MSDFLMERQKLLDRLNAANENLRQSTRDKIRAEDQMIYWQKQIQLLTAQLEPEAKE